MPTVRDLAEGVVSHRIGHRHDVAGPLVPHELGTLERAWAAVWGRAQRISPTRRCIMCRALVGDRPPGESPLYCSDACRDRHRDCGG